MQIPAINTERRQIILVWQDPESRKNFRIGTLSKNGRYEFSYGYEFDEAVQSGFALLFPFQEPGEKYVRDALFPIFSRRLPDPKRRDMPAILEKYGLDHYDDFELLKRSRSKLPTDNYRFVDPELDEGVKFNKELELAGVRYYLGCDGEDCEKSLALAVGEQLQLAPEPTNVQDPQAVAVKRLDGTLIGYVPRYYSQEVFRRMNGGASFSCVVTEYAQAEDCRYCISVYIAEK